MKITYSSRNTEKTSDLIRLSAEKNIPILCMPSSKRYIKDLAKELGCVIPEPVTINDYSFNSNEDILVDNANYVLQSLLNCNIVAMTMSG